MGIDGAAAQDAPVRQRVASSRSPKSACRCGEVAPRGAASCIYRPRRLAYQCLNNDSNQEEYDAAPQIRSLPRPASPDRRASDAAVPPRPRFRRAYRRARLRRILVRRASFLGLGDDRLAGDVSGRSRRAHQAHQARHRRGVAALSPSVQRRAAHGAARPHDRRPRHLRLRPRRAGLGRAYARHRSDDAARPPGRGDRRHQAAVRRRARHRQERLVHHERRGAAAPAACRRRCRSWWRRRFRPRA